MMVIGSTWDEDDDGVDVHVRFASGEAYVGTFFTRRNIERLMTQVLPENGECAGGTYFWSVDMIIVGRLTKDTIQTTINTLAATDMLEPALTRLDTELDYEVGPMLPPEVAVVWTAATDENEHA